MARWLTYSLGNPDLIKHVKEENLYISKKMKNDWTEVYGLNHKWFRRFLLETTDVSEKSNALTYLFKNDLKYFYMGNYKRDIPEELLNDIFFSVDVKMMKEFAEDDVDFQLTDKHAEHVLAKNQLRSKATKERDRLLYGSYISWAIPVYEYLLEVYEKQIGKDALVRSRIRYLTSIAE